MKKTIAFIKNKTMLLGAVLIATVVGSATTAMVMAAVPDSGGTIHGCYRNSSNLLDAKGALKIIDSASENCTAQETALNWSQGGNTAYGHITGTYDAEESTWSHQTDTGRTSGITSIQYITDNEDGSVIDACITAAVEPKNINLTGGNGFPPGVAVRTAGLNAGDNGWSSPKANAVCGTGGANGFIYSLGYDTWFTLH